MNGILGAAAVNYEECLVDQDQVFHKSHWLTGALFGPFMWAVLAQTRLEQGRSHSKKRLLFLAYHDDSEWTDVAWKHRLRDKYEKAKRKLHRLPFVRTQALRKGRKILF